MQDGGTSQIQVNGRFVPSRCVTLYRICIPLLCLQFVHSLPELVNKGLLLLLEGVFQLDLFSPEGLQVALLRVRLALQLLDPPHQLVYKALLLLLQGVFQLNLLVTELIEFPREVVRQALLLLLVVQGQ